MQGLLQKRKRTTAVETESLRTVSEGRKKPKEKELLPPQSQRWPRHGRSDVETDFPLVFHLRAGSKPLSRESWSSG